MNDSLIRNAGKVRAGCLATLLLFPGLAAAKKKAAPRDTGLAAYLERARVAAAPTRTLGSLWSAQGQFSDLARDDKAARVNDLITIRIVEQTTAAADGSVKSQRQFTASSGMGELLGQVGARSGLQGIFSPRSQQTLAGQAQTASNTRLRTSLTGRVIEVLPNGFLVVEAARGIEMNNQRQTVILRGIVRPSDLAPDNSVLSTAVSDLEIEMSGKGVISDGVRPPNRIVRLSLRLVGF